LRWVGNVGTGFDQKLLANLNARLQPLIIEKCAFAERPDPYRGTTWVRPELVCQVKFSNWTLDNRLRAPVFLGLREDKRPGEVTREGPELLAPSAPEATLTIDGRTLKFTNLKKVFYPAEGYTKRDIINYYDA